jgi:hypothetical protein
MGSVDLSPIPPSPHNLRARRVPNDLICVVPSLDYQRASTTENGGSACVIHSLCCPVCGRPVSPRKSHSKSQRGQTSGHSQLRQATVEAGQVPSEPSPATSSDVWGVTGGHGVAGSNPPSRLATKLFRIYLCPYQSQQKSHLPLKRPLRGVRRSCAQAPYQGICQNDRADETSSQGVKDH